MEQGEGAKFWRYIYQDEKFVQCTRQAERVCRGMVCRISATHTTLVLSIFKNFLIEIEQTQKN